MCIEVLTRSLSEIENIDSPRIGYRVMNRCKSGGYSSIMHDTVRLLRKGNKYKAIIHYSVTPLYIGGWYMFDDPRDAYKYMQILRLLLTDLVLLKVECWNVCAEGLQFDFPVFCALDMSILEEIPKG